MVTSSESYQIVSPLDEEIYQVIVSKAGIRPCELYELLPKISPQTIYSVLLRLRRQDMIRIEKLGKRLVRLYPAAVKE